MTAPRWPWADLILVLVVLAAAGGSRFWYVWECADRGWEPGPLEVQGRAPLVSAADKEKRPRGREQASEVDVLVRNLSEERRFASRAPLSAREESTAHVAPGYYWLFTAVDGWFESPDQADQIMRWVHAGLGTLTALCYFFFARMVFGNRIVALLTGLFCALHPFWIINTAELNDGVLTTFLLSSCLLLGTRASRLGGPMTSLLFGLALAGLAMVRAALLPLAVAALLWFLLRCRAMPRGWFCALLAFLGFGNGLAPWTVRNFQAFGEPVPVADSTFLHLWIGNHPTATGGPLPADHLHRTLSDTRRHELAAQTNQARRYNLLSRDVIDVVAAEPGATLTRRIWAGLYFLCGEAWFSPQRTLALPSPAIGHHGCCAWLTDAKETVLAGTLLAMILLSLLGWRWSYGWRKQAKLATLAFLLIPLPYLLTHGEVLSGPRLPLDGVLLTFSAFAVTCCLPGQSQLRGGG